MVPSPEGPAVASDASLGPVQDQPQPAAKLEAPVTQDTGAARPSESAVDNSAKTATVEQPLSKEKRQKIKRDEVRMVTHSVVNKRGLEVWKGKKKNLTPSDEAAKDYFSLYHHILYPDEDFGKPTTITGDNPRFQSISGQLRAVTVAQGGEKLEAITGKVVKNGEVFFKCVVNRNEVEISGQEMLNAQLLSERENIIGLTEEGSAERQVLEAHIQSLTDPKAEISVNEATMSKAAEKAGLVSPEAAQVIIDRADTSDELKNELKALLKGKTVATPEDVGTIFHKLNHFEHSIDAKTALITDHQETIKYLEQIIQNLPENSRARVEKETQVAALKAEMKQAQDEVEEMKAIKKAMTETEDGDTEEGIIKMVQNIYDQGSAKKLEAALQAGDYEESLKQVLGLIPEDHPEANKYRTLATAALKYGGWGALAIVALMIMKAVGGNQ